MVRGLPRAGCTVTLVDRLVHCSEIKGIDRLVDGAEMIEIDSFRFRLDFRRLRGESTTMSVWRSPPAAPTAI